MKATLLFILCFIAIFSYSQAIDSTEIKLSQYQKWHELGLVSDDEYEAAKSQLLGITVKQKSVVTKKKPVYNDAKTYLSKRVTYGSDTITMRELKNKYNTKIIAGSILLGIGLTGIATSAILIGKIPTRSLVIGMTIGAAVTVGGGGLLGVGLSHRRAYNEIVDQLAIKYTNNTIGLAYCF